MHTHTDPQCTQHWMPGQQTNRLDRYITVEREKKNRLSRPASSSLGTEWKKQEKRNNADKKKELTGRIDENPAKCTVSYTHTQSACKSNGLEIIGKIGTRRSERISGAVF